MKLGPVTNLDKINKTTSKKFDDDVIVLFGTIRKPDSGHTACKTYIFINSNLLSYKH